MTVGNFLKIEISKKFGIGRVHLQPQRIIQLQHCNNERVITSYVVISYPKRSLVPNISNSIANTDGQNTQGIT